MNPIVLVGAGPGSPEHLTLAARQALLQAEVVVYDTLVDPRILALLDPQVNTHSVQGLSQAEINDLLIHYYHNQQRVVRLKSGDPFIFGKATQELQALTAANCTYHVIPGISTITGAATLAGIPLTDRDWGHTVGVFTAHAPELLDWSALARMDTLVGLMGVNYLTTVQTKLLQNGRDSDTPAALVYRAGQVGQTTWTGTLAQLATQPAKAPSVLILGAGVKCRGLGQSHLPLQGKNILITRAAGSGSELEELLGQSGANVVSLPTLVVTPPPDWAPLDAALAQLEQFNWLILTSANAVDYFLKRLWHHQRDGRSLAHLKIAVVGEKTALNLQKWGLRADLIPPEFVADQLLTEFPQDCQDLRVLFPRVASGGREVLVQGLQERGAQVLEVAAYETGCPAEIRAFILDYLRQGLIDVLTFTSSKTVVHFWQLLAQAAPEQGQKWLNSSLIASIGPQTSRACERYFQRVDVAAKEYTLAGLVGAIVAYYRAPISGDNLG
ncbi:uroporphyrin-III C-methyltransferase [Gloeomargarita lithophora Alchichica-D10]|uniref:uroporphyrinogen-III C-methyltransferase n=1 Tax=Gloeomargarita lithophora Alchichica-D10 TaxID=1188229 RepID=A0A1J0A933_9CYAN|nr:uroporphyrinogen-III C-methyltransferase [Gloeomargarita lithophora]APB32448.1 uroporphyrin-III C-methyltransferase [Gloeomargarita lithophora Alchichica-D10]